MTLSFLVFFIFGILFVLVLTETCPDGKFKANYIDDCVDCPENPETNCEAEGDDSESCKISCIKDTYEEKSNKKTIALGVSFGAVALIIVVIGLGWYLKKKKKNNESLNVLQPVEGDDRGDDEVNSNEDSNPPSSPGPESPIYPARGIASDLNIRKDDPSSSVY